MIARWLLAALVLTTVASLCARAQDAPQYMTPTRQHEAMARDVGVWDGETTTWSAPGAEPTKDKGAETNKMLGKLWLTSEYKGTFMGQEFIGHMQLGYDPLKKKYVGTWVDTVSPFLFTLEGDYDVASHTLTMMMHGTSAMTGQPETAKAVTRYIDDNNKVFEMHMPVEGQEGQWWKMFEIKYTRRK
jgi:hypothetical protein